MALGLAQVVFPIELSFSLVFLELGYSEWLQLKFLIFTASRPKYFLIFLEESSSLTARLIPSFHIVTPLQ